MAAKKKLVVLRMKSCPGILVSLTLIGELVKENEDHYVLKNPNRVAEFYVQAQEADIDPVTQKSIVVPVMRFNTSYLSDDLFSSSEEVEVMRSDVQLASEVSEAVAGTYEKWLTAQRAQKAGLVTPTNHDLTRMHNRQGARA